MENLTIEFLNMKASKLVFSLGSIEGKTLLNKQFLPKTERFREELGLTGFSPGMYLIKIHSNDCFKTKRLIIE